jgi:hypothetical protein
MRATNDHRKLWKQLHDHGDINKIAAEIWVSRYTVSAALASGEGTEKIIFGITAYYRAKQARLEKSLTGTRDQATD